jgi:hypothetical protein
LFDLSRQIFLKYIIFNDRQLKILMIKVVY